MTSELMRGDSFDAKMLISGQISESIRRVGIGLLLSSSARVRPRVRSRCAEVEVEEGRVWKLVLCGSWVKGRR